MTQGEKGNESGIFTEFQKYRQLFGKENYFLLQSLGDLKVEIACEIIAEQDQALQTK